MLTRYLNNQATAPEKEFIEQWYSAYGSDFRLSLSPDQRQELENRLWKSITTARHTGSRHARRGPATRSMLRITGIAASVVFAGCLLYYALDMTSSGEQIAVKNGKVKRYSITNTAPFPQSSTLPDGTIIKLEPKSSLQVVNMSDDNKREVHLEGEAFFEVAHDTLRPFFVYTGNITTKVLGTSFTVSARENVIFVAVKTGTVSVTQTTRKSVSPRHTLTEEIILTPNQKAVYNGKQISMAIVEKPQRIHKPEEQPHMKFDEQPVSDILAALEDAYGIDIQYDRDLIKTCILTTTLSNEDLYDRLNIICKAIKGSYKTEGSTITVVSNGCH